MKKIVLTIVGSLLISLCAVQAQQDETASKSKNKEAQKENTETSRDTQWNRDQAWQQQSDREQYANEGMVEIQKEQIPSSLKATLQDEKYAGWENATIYHNTNTGEYVIAPRAYRFDEKGKEIEMGDARYQQGRSSGYSTGDRSQSSDRAGQQPSGHEQAREQMGEIPTSASQEQSSNDQSTGQQQNYDQSSNRDQSTNTDRQPSSGYRSGQDTQTDGTSQSQNNGATQSQTDGTSQSQSTQSQSQNNQDQ